MKAITWSEFDGKFIVLMTDKDVKNCVDAEWWPVARWNAEKKVYEENLGGEWQEVEKQE